jgi:hypothetical protein
VFDYTLKQALAVDLEQSPFLNVLSERKVADTLRLMGHTTDRPLLGDLAQEVCQRTGSKAVLGGSIANLGNQYVVGLNAMNCQTGGKLVQEEVRTNGKENVLKGLDKAVSDLREKLGESLTSIQKFDTPLEEAAPHRWRLCKPIRQPCEQCSTREALMQFRFSGTLSIWTRTSPLHI